MEGEKKKKSKKKSKRDHFDGVDEEIERAMGQMEEAMERARIAQESAAKTTKAFSGINGFQATNGVPGGITVNNYGSPNGKGPIIFVNGAQNLQIGNHHVMNINNNSKIKTKKKIPRVHRESSNSDVGGDEPTRKPRADPVTPVQRDIPLQDREPSELTPAEKKRYLILNSPRVVTEDEIKLCTVYIGQFPRFLRMLGLEDAQIDNLRQENETAREIIYQGLLLWKQKMDRDATVGALAKVLQKVDCADALVYFRP